MRMPEAWSLQATSSRLELVASLPSTAVDEEIDTLHVLTIEDFLKMQPLEWCVTSTARASPSSAGIASSSMHLANKIENACASCPSSPSSVAYMPPYCDQAPSVFAIERGPAISLEPCHQRSDTKNGHTAIKQEPKAIIDFASLPTPLPLPVVAGVVLTEDVWPKAEHVEVLSAANEEREILRKRQRGYEKNYRSRKRAKLMKMRATWLELESELLGVRSKSCSSLVIHKGATSLKKRLRALREHERILKQDNIALKSMQAWDKLTRIREYTDKEVLRTMAEWKHSAEKIMGTDTFDPYTPMPLNFTW